MVAVEGWISDGEDIYYRGGGWGDGTKEGTQAVPLCAKGIRALVML